MFKCDIKAIVIGAVLIAGLTILSFYQGTFRVESIGFSEFKKTERDEEYRNPLRNCKVVITSFHIGLGGHDSIGMEIATPYENQEQKMKLMKKSIMIKNDFLFEVNEEELREWFKQKNYKAIKSKFLQISNRYMDNPIKKVYLSKVFYE